MSTNTDKAADVYAYDTRNGLLNDEIVDIIEDSDGNLWVATLNNLHRMKVIKEDQPGGILFEKILEKNLIMCLFEDSEGSLWIGTWDSGLIRLKNAVFIAHAPSTSLVEKNPGETIRSLFENPQGEIWIGSSLGKLYKFRNNECIEFLEIPGAASTIINAIREDNHGNLWLGAHGKGLYQRKKGTDTLINFNTQDGLADNIVISIFNDSKNNLWIGTYDGVSRYRNGIFKSLKARDGILGNFVNNVYEDNNHHIRIASNKGIYVIEKGELTRKNMIEYLPDIPVACIHEEYISSGNDNDSNGYVSWVATHGAGLKRFKDGKFFSYTTAEGMTSNFIYQMLEDERGNLWMMSDSGILRVNKKELNGFAEGRVDRINCTSFGISDGMKSSDFFTFFSRNSALKTREGEFWFVTTKGITIVNPGEIKIIKSPPNVIIEEVFFNDRSIPLSIKEREEKDFKEVSDFVFHFTAPTFLSPGKIKFKYKLDGYDRDWAFLPPGEKRTARYKDLSSGTYTFKVTACNSDGVWNKRGDSITFTLTPLFYETIFFKILVLFILLVLTLGGYFLYKKQWLRKIGKYKGPSMNPIYIKECIKKLDYLMEIEKVYRDETISLQSLSGKLSITPHQLSRILNEKLNKNFPDFINTYRVQEAKKLLSDPGRGNQKILTIAFDVGFNTKVAFNTAFKKHTKMTPSQYREKARKSVSQ
jgi:ligand-binding sensor domain-containing protein/AraC-like DNA-binding protein